MAWNVWGGVQLSWPVFQGLLTRGQVREADATLVAARAERDGLVNEVWVAVQQAATSVRSAQEALVAADEALTAARERLRLADGRYTAGVGSIIELSATPSSARRPRARSASRPNTRWRPRARRWSSRSAAPESSRLSGRSRARAARLCFAPVSRRTRIISKTPSNFNNLNVADPSADRASFEGRVRACKEPVGQRAAAETARHDRGRALRPAPRGRRHAARRLLRGADPARAAGRRASSTASASTSTPARAARPASPPATA